MPKICAPTRRTPCQARTNGLDASTTGSSSGFGRTRQSRKMAPTTLVWCRASVPTMTFSSAVISGNSRMFWNVRAIPSRLIWCGLHPTIRCPSNVTLPDVGLKTSVITLKQVGLPAPLGPMRPRISPLYNLKLTSLRATTPPNRRVTSSTSRSTSSEVCSGDDIDGGLLLPVVQLPGSAPARDQALRAQDHDHDERETDQQRAVVLEDPEPLGQVGQQNGAQRDAGDVAGAAEPAHRHERDRQGEPEARRV